MNGGLRFRYMFFLVVCLLGCEGKEDDVPRKMIYIRADGSIGAELSKKAKDLMKERRELNMGKDQATKKRRSALSKDIAKEIRCHMRLRCRCLVIVFLL